MSEPVYQYQATIERWVDGDTVDLTVDLGFYISCKARFRLYGIDTPERGRTNWAEATAFANNYAPVGTEVLIQVYKDADKYGRFLANVLTSEDAQSVNEALVEAGLAVHYMRTTPKTGVVSKILKWLGFNRV